LRSRTLYRTNIGYVPEVSKVYNGSRSLKVIDSLDYIQDYIWLTISRPL